MRQTLLSAGIVSTSQFGNPELDSWTIEALPVTPSLLDLAIPRMVLYMLYLYNCVCVELLQVPRTNTLERGTASMRGHFPSSTLRTCATPLPNISCMTWPIKPLLRRESVFPSPISVLPVCPHVIASKYLGE